MKTIALFDLDTPIYKAAAAVETRTILVKHNPTGIEKAFSNRTAFKKLLEEKQKLDKLPEYSIVDQQEAEPLSHALKLLNSHVDNIIDNIWPDEVVFMLSGSTNFRNDLPFPTKYKSNRTGVKPLLLKEVQKYALKKYDVIVADNEEPDDVQIWMGYEQLQQGNKAVVVSIDKDSKAYSGLHLYNPDKPELGVHLIPRLGVIEIDSKNEVRANGMLQYGLQMLIGDAIDGFKPTELCSVRFGEKSAYAILKSCQTEKEVLEVVVKKYQDWYPSAFTYTAWDGKQIESNWQHMLNLYHMACRMKATRNDALIAFDFYKQHGVTIC